MKKQEVIETRSFFSDIQLWPQQPEQIDPEGWLNNFDGEEDIGIATALLDSFLYIDRRQTLKMFQSAFHGLSYRIERTRGSGLSVGSAWREFLGKVAVSYPAGSDRDVAASGRIFMREARQTLVAEDRLYDPEELVRAAAVAWAPIDVVLVDDFAGTGTQFLDSWRREYVMPSGADQSLESLSQMSRLADVYYVPAVATQHAISRIEVEAPSIRVRPSHVLPFEYQASHSRTKIVPEDLVDRLEPFLRRYAARAGYDLNNVFGYGGLGLAIAFEHSTPDNSLPIYYSESPGWKTLRRRHT